MCACASACTCACACVCVCVCDAPYVHCKTPEHPHIHLHNTQTRTQIQTDRHIHTYTLTDTHYHTHTRKDDSVAQVPRASPTGKRGGGGGRHITDAHRLANTQTHTHTHTYTTHTHTHTRAHTHKWGAMCICMCVCVYVCVCVLAYRLTQSMIYVPLLSNSLQKSILLSVRYNFLKSCSEDFILQDLLIRTRWWSTGLISQHCWVVDFHLINMIIRKCVVLVRYQCRKGISAGLALTYFFMIHRFGRCMSRDTHMNTRINDSYIHVNESYEHDMNTRMNDSYIYMNESCEHDMNTRTNA